MSDFFHNPYGSCRPLASRPLWTWQLRDRLYDLRLRTGGSMERLRRKRAVAFDPRRILIVGVEVTQRPEDVHRVMRRLKDGSRHDITVSVVPMASRGKFENIDLAIRQAPPLANFDWLVIADDDIAFAPNFLDDLLLVAEATPLSLLQPAHAFWSHTSFAVTQRHWGSLVRQTDFVEIGPLTLIKADVFEQLIPFPPSRWGYGIDLVWSDLLQREGRTLGVVDATPIRHLRPVGVAYDIDLAIEEGETLMQRFGVSRGRRDFLSEGHALRL